MMQIRSAFVALILILALTASGPSLVAISKSIANVDSQDKPGLQGNWNGLLEVSGAKSRLVLKLTKAADGSFVGTMDSLLDIA